MTIIQSIRNMAYMAIPKLKIDTPSNMLKKIEKIAIPAIALASMGSVQGADAGPWFACICIAACVPLMEAPPLFAACLAACGVALATPTP